MKIKQFIQIVKYSFIICAFTSCKKEDTAVSGNTSGTIVNGGTTDITDVVKNNFKSMVTISTTSTSITLKSDGIPDHVSPYWVSSNSLYEDQIEGQNVNPGNIGVQAFAMTIPLKPSEASSKEATSLGPIGMALNGVAIYNDREGGNVAVDASTLKSFDRAGAHNGPGNLYHYHFTGDFTGNDNDYLIGFLRDGFPLYGRKNSDGTYPTDLDANGGHFGVTKEFPDGIYHYHAANVAYLNSRFYVLKSGSYNGTKGTFTF